MLRSAPMTGKSGPVQANPFERQWAETGGDVLAAVQAVGSSGWYILGEQVRAFETELAEQLAAEHVVGCASGLDAIEIGLRALELAPGEPVLTTPLSAFATTLGILRAGGRPVFVDVDDRGLLDLDAAESTLHDGGIRFMVPVHLFGNPLALDRLVELRNRFELRIVEDAAQAVGAMSGRLPVGSAGQVATYSFYPTKNLGALGDGGAISTNDSTIDGTARSLRDYGQSHKYEHTRLGLNSRLDEIQAAILRRAFLPRLPGWQTRRSELANRYLEGIQNRAVQCIGTNFDAGCVWHLFPVRVDAEHRSQLLSHLREAGVQAAVHYPGLIPDQAAMQHDLSQFQNVGPLERARELCRTEVSLPISPYLTNDEADRVIELVNAWSP